MDIKAALLCDFYVISMKIHDLSTGYLEQVGTANIQSRQNSEDITCHRMQRP